MSADIINLRQARKARARLEKEDQAQANRLHFGRSKTEKQQTRANNDKEQAKLDAHRLDAPQSAKPPADGQAEDR